MALQPEPFLPPPPKFPWEVRGYQEPSGAKHRHRTGQPSGARHTTRQSPRNRKPSWASSEAEASSGHDKESGALTGSLSNRLHFRDKGAGGWKWPGNGHYKKSRLPQTSLHGQDRQDTLKLFLRARQDLKNMTLGTWHGTPGRDVDWIHGARVSGDRRA